MIQYWILLNLFISLYELYCFNNKHLINLNNVNRDILTKSWSEYSRVDPRYQTNNIGSYVWNFELLNVGNTILLTLSYLLNKPYINIVLIIQALATLLYFTTLMNDYTNNKELRDTINKTAITKRVLYYTISFIWILVPLYLLYFLTF